MNDKPMGDAMKVGSFKELMNGSEYAEIVCLYKGTVVRKLTVKGDVVVLDALTQTVDVPIDTPISYSAFDPFDRGNMLFDIGLGTMKLCTEQDIVRYPNGDEFRVEPEMADWRVEQTA